MKDYYKILNVERTASKEEIKKSFRSLSMRYHPDHNSGDAEAEEKFKEINEAYSVLSDDSKRREYDNPNPFGGLGSMFRGFDFNPFGNSRQRRRPNPNAPVDGKFIGVEIELPLKTFLFGGKFNLKLSYQEYCGLCGGKGFSSGTECEVCHGEGCVQHVERRPGFMSTSTVPCHHCGGLGMVATEGCTVCNGQRQVLVKDKVFEFDIPPGTNIGTKMILSSVGRVGVNGGRRGDVGLFIVGIKALDLNNVSSNKLGQLKNLLEEIEDESKDSEL